MTIEELREKYKQRIIMPLYIGAGWIDLVDNALGAMIDIDPDICIVQVKEKFGDLRVYYRATKSGPELQRIVGEATTQARSTCDVCGTCKEVQVVYDGGWVRVRCNTHKDTR